MTLKFLIGHKTFYQIAKWKKNCIKEIYIKIIIIMIFKPSNIHQYYSQKNKR